MAEKRTADDLPAQREQPFYSRAVRERIAELILCKQDADKEQFFADLEALAYGLTVAGKRKIIDPRLTRDRLDEVTAAIRRMEEELNALERLEAQTSHVRSIASAWGNRPAMERHHWIGTM